MYMKKWIVTLSALFCSLSLLAQGTVTTKKYLLSDFTDKVTQVVMSGNEIFCSALRQEVVANWTASPFEFCTLEQFEARKTSDRYYFLIAAESQFKGEEVPGVTFLTLVKGGPEAQDGIGAMQEIVSLPLQAALGGNGRELIYLPSLLRTIQAYTLAAMDSEKTAYNMENWVNRQYARNGRTMQICIAREDLSETLTEKELGRYLDADFHIVESTEEADKRFLDRAYNTLVGYTVEPAFPDKNAYCYALLFEAYTGTLYYIGRHKYSEKKGCGFTVYDMKYLSSKR